ncbi:unnamed protein product [Rhodiola kirilowii]
MATRNRTIVFKKYRDALKSVRAACSDELGAVHQRWRPGDLLLNWSVPRF